jgi:three-Cys-motif partner protein
MVQPLPLDLFGDAICLSGLTGTKLKCSVIGNYYSFWWGITSGGPSANYQYPTAIVELNAATGEDYIEDTHETVLGSSGHALELKAKESPKTTNLKIVLIEDDPTCYSHLKNVMRRRWPNVPISEAEGPPSSNLSNVFLLNKELEDALKTMEDIDLGNALYFFDPLRSVNYETVNKVAQSRMPNFFQTGTEFFIFVFTSDWFLGRDELSPLPCSSMKDKWNQEEWKTVSQADELFGSIDWRDHILTNNPIQYREQTLIQLYRERLHRWFRYVLPMPFNPKQNQVFHLILCSNYEAGVRATRDFYCFSTHNTRYSPDNSEAVRRFRILHPELWSGITGNKRPLQWKLLWKIIRDHEEGICDLYCRDLIDTEPNVLARASSLDWLEKKGYLKLYDVEYAWRSAEKRYILNSKIVKKRLDIDPPQQLTPLLSEGT